MTTALILLSELRGLVTTELGDSSLELLLRSAERAIEARFGAVGVDVTEVHEGDGSYLVLRTPTASITSITERVGDTDTLLADDDWRLRPDRLSLLRLGTGTNQRTRWGGPVTVVHRPDDDRAERIRVAAALVRLDLNYTPGITMEQIGSWLEQKAAGSDAGYEKEREAILTSLRPAGNLLGWA